MIKALYEKFRFWVQYGPGGIYILIVVLSILALVSAMNIFNKFSPSQQADGPAVLVQGDLREEKN